MSNQESEADRQKWLAHYAELDELLAADLGPDYRMGEDWRDDSTDNEDLWEAREEQCRWLYEG